MSGLCCPDISLGHDGGDTLEEKRGESDTGAWPQGPEIWAPILPCRNDRETAVSLGIVGCQSQEDGLREGTLQKQPCVFHLRGSSTTPR